MKKYLPHAIFAAIVLAIMLPLYRRGFIFALDMIFTPGVNLGYYLRDGAIPADFPIMVLIKLLGFILPMDIIQKFILSFILFLSGFLMYRLAKKILPEKWAILSGIFYMVNPFVYERFLAGHWYILLGYAIFPLLVELFMEFLERGDKRSFVKFALLFSVFPIIALHWAYISAGFLLILGFVRYYIMRKDKLGNSEYFSQARVKKFAVFSALGAAIFLVINSFWLIGFLNPTGDYRGIGSGDFEAFKTQSDKSFGVFFNVLSLYGFWSKGYFSTKDFFSYWWILTPVMLFFAVYGIIGFKKIGRGEGGIKKFLIPALAAIFVPVVLLSVGYGSGISKPVIDLLREFLPGFNGFRDTEKISGLLAFSYAILVPLGGLVFARKQKYIFWLIALVPFASTYTILWGFSGQLKASDYPVSWYEADKMLIQDKNSKLLFLPWHGYPNISFVDNYKISNPAPKFFKVSVVASKNTDNAYLDESKEGVWDKKMFLLLQGFETLDENIDFLSSQGITHVALAKEADYKRYTFLERSTKIEKILERNDFALYKVQ